MNLLIDMGLTRLYLFMMILNCVLMPILRLKLKSLFMMMQYLKTAQKIAISGRVREIGNKKRFLK